MRKNTDHAVKNAVRIVSAEFASGASSRNQIPPPGDVEIAFAGRSNVGKSSLLNMLVSRKGLARTSRTPGCTRQINFFNVVVAGGPSLVFADLPGYGYAKVSKSESRDWKILLEGYLRDRSTLKGVVILVDARRGLEQEEIDLIDFLRVRPELEIVVAATKLDKLPRSMHKPRLKELARIIHDAISADGRGFRGAFGAVGPPSAGPQGKRGARRTAGPRRTVRTPQVRGAPYDLCSKGIGSSEWSRRELSGLARNAGVNVIGTSADAGLGREELWACVLRGIRA
ncbi:MAG: ribosome biogenesis GTP-binding protein YihA/YsxC [Polyangiaceae bacterium]|nr:ribosome biogenesis GTP-binding protein YihA/YsxC [Polyangiaceae bacterium]